MLPIDLFDQAICFFLDGMPYMSWDNFDCCHVLHVNRKFDLQSIHKQKPAVTPRIAWRVKRGVSSHHHHN